MEGAITHDSTLDYVEFHIFPSHNRYEATVWSSNREEKVASGCLEQLLLHSHELQNLSSKGSNTMFKMLPPDNLNDVGWFTTATLLRFLHIIGLPDILGIGKEISQLEETRKFKLSSSVKAEVDITTSTESKNELLLAVDLRLTSLKEELAAAFNKAIVTECSSKDISNLRNFSLHFGAKFLRDSLQKSIELSTVPYKSSTDDEDSTFSTEEDQPSVERSRVHTRSAMARRSASPMRRIQLGRSGSRRAAALSIRSLNNFPSRANSASQRDAASNSSEEEDSDRPPKNNVLRMSVQDKISLFENKQRDQGADIQKTNTSNVTAGANKAVLKRWSSGMGERAAQCLPDEASPRSPKNIAPDGKTDPNNNISKTGTYDENTANITLLSPEKEPSEQLQVEVDALQPERAESKEKHPASNKRSQQKGAELNGLLKNLMESKPVKPQKMTSDNSKNKIPKEQRGGLYDIYKEKREKNLQREATGERVERDSEFKVTLQPSNVKKAKMGSTIVTGANKRHAALNEPQKTQKNSIQLINCRTTKTSAVKKSTSKSSPLPAAHKSWPSTPSPARTPTGPTSTPKKHTPQSSASVVHSSTKSENLQPRLKTLKATQPDSDKRIKAINEKKLPTVTENRKTRKTNNIQTSKANTTDASKPSFYNKVTRKSTVVPLETKPFLRKGSGIGPGVGPVVIKSKVVAEPDETLRSSGGLIQAKESKMVRRIDISTQSQENECVMRENNASLEAESQLVSPTKCDESEGSEGGGGNSRAEVSEINTAIEEELGISPTAWVVTEEEHNDEITPCKEGPIQIASPAKVAISAGFSRQRVRRSLSQMLLEDINEADISEWGNAEHPPTMVYQKDAPRGLKRLLKFARKAKADSHLTGWSSPSAFSEGEDDVEEPKASRSFFSLSAFRGTKTNETKPLHH